MKQPPERDEDILNALAGAVRGLAKAEATGDLASLRRLDLDNPMAPAFFRLIARHTPHESPSPETMRAYALVAAILALRPDTLVPGRRLGSNLVDAGVSEARVQRLLAARGETFRDLALRTARVLVRSGAFSYEQLCRLILAGDGPAAEHLRLAVARDFWGALDGRSRAPTAVPAFTES